jgi:hypothetical protein
MHRQLIARLGQAAALGWARNHLKVFDFPINIRSFYNAETLSA